jgi:hypothetical protein
MDAKPKSFRSIPSKTAHQVNMKVATDSYYSRLDFIPDIWTFFGLQTSCRNDG